MHTTTEELIEKLTNLQLEQQVLIEELRKRTKTNHKDIQAGETVVVLTSGIRCNIGDKAKVTKVTKAYVHVQVLRTGQNTHRKRKNIKQAYDHE